MRRVGLGTLMAAIFLVVPSASLAADVFVPASSPPFPNKVAVFRAELGETNDLTVTEEVIFPFPHLAFSDSIASLVAGTDCTEQPDGRVLCDPETTNVEARLRDGDDTAHVTISRIATIWAGSGDDTVVADSFGAFTRVYGGGGDDEISAGGEGSQLADGGPGDDTVNAGGFAGNATGLGGSGNDIINFRTFLGGLATLDGGPGDDTIVSQPAGGTATGGAGDDIIAIHGQIPMMSGEGFTISGGDGDDTISGDAFADTIDGGTGRDYIDVLDGGADTVECGPGTDVVRHDATDTVAADCEILLGP